MRGDMAIWTYIRSQHCCTSIPLKAMISLDFASKNCFLSVKLILQHKKKIMKIRDPQKENLQIT